MTSRAIRTEGDIEALRVFLRGRKLPVTVEIVAGVKRSNPQNKLGHKWYGEIAAQLGDQTALDVKKYCKLHFGVPIMRAASEIFRDEYDRVLRRLPYETKLALMAFYPVTSIMTTKQETEYLEAIRDEFIGKGFRLTDPEMQKYQHLMEDEQ